MELSINELADLTGRDRRTITKRLERMQYSPGKKGAYLYESAEALALIYQIDAVGGTLDQARTRAANEQAELTRVRREEAERKRPPLEMVLTLLDEIAQATAATLKAAKGKVLTDATINELFGAFRELVPKLLTSRSTWSR